MSLEAKIDNLGDIWNKKLGDPVGECNGVVIEFGENFTQAEVNPSPAVCEECLLKGHCTQSLAD
jgi:endonuclease III